MIAMTSRATAEDVEYCIECGFNYHFAKTDQKPLLEKVQAIRNEILTQELSL